MNGIVRFWGKDIATIKDKARRVIELLYYKNIDKQSVVQKLEDILRILDKHRVEGGPNGHVTQDTGKRPALPAVTPDTRR